MENLIVMLMLRRKRACKRKYPPKVGSGIGHVSCLPCIKYSFQYSFFFKEKKEIIGISISPIVIPMLKPLQLILGIGHFLAKLLSELTQDIGLALNLVPLSRGQATLL